MGTRATKFERVESRKLRQQQQFRPRCIPIHRSSRVRALLSHCTPCTCRTVHATTWPPVIRVPSFLPSTLTAVSVCPQLHYTRALCNAQRAHAPPLSLSLSHPPGCKPFQKLFGHARCVFKPIEPCNERYIRTFAFVISNKPV